MKKTVRVYKSFSEAEKADKDYYRGLTPAQRIAMLLTLREQYSPYPNDITEGLREFIESLNADLEYL